VQGQVQGRESNRSFSHENRVVSHLLPIESGYGLADRLVILQFDIAESRGSAGNKVANDTNSCCPDSARFEPFLEFVFRAVIRNVGHQKMGFHGDLSVEIPRQPFLLALLSPNPFAFIYLKIDIGCSLPFCPYDTSDWLQ